MPFRPVIAIILLCFGAIAFACDGGGGSDAPLTLAGYFQQLEAMINETEERENALNTQLEDGLAAVKTADDAFDLVRDIFGEQIDSFDEFVDELDSLEPPEGLEDVHDESIEALRAFIDAFEDLRSQLDDVDSLIGLDALVSAEAFAEAAEVVEEACFAFQDAADENGIDIDLDCADE